MNREEFCPNCEDYRSTHVVERETTLKVRDRKISVTYKAPVCDVCGEILGDDALDQQVLDAVNAEYRRQTDLLTPERIRAIRQRYRLSQKSFAALLGMSEATINRYEQGALQDPLHDTAIRACENPQVMRDLLERRAHLLSDWQRERALAALAGKPSPAEDTLEHLGEIDWVCMPREVTDLTGYRRFDYPRFAGAVLWYCSRLGEVSRTQINKLLFYGDFLNFKVSTLSLTGAAYRKARHGPVPADYDALLSRMESEDLLVREEREFANGYLGYYYKPGGKAAGLSPDFGPHELKVMELVSKEIGGLSAKAASDRSHLEPAWKETEDGKLISYQLARHLSLSLPL